MCQLVYKDTGKKPDRDDNPEDIGHVSCRNNARIDRDPEDRADQVRCLEDLTPDDPGKEGNDEEECPVQLDGNPIKGPDFQRAVHKRSIFLCE